MPALYVVATPIGNLEDISQRAIRILKEVKLIAAEDTRQTRRLLNAYDIKTPTTSYHEHNKLTKLDYLVSRLEHDDIALVSDAGMPGISDPGYELIAALSARRVPIIPVPGPSALVSALVVSGLPTDRFLYLGFLPHKRGERLKALNHIKNEKATLVFYESPHRLADTLKDMLAVLENRRVAVCRELTKIHEEVFRGTFEEAITHFQEPRGEFTLVVEGNTANPAEIEPAEILNKIRSLQQEGGRARDSIDRLAAESGRSRKEIYQLWLKSK